MSVFLGDHDQGLRERERVRVEGKETEFFGRSRNKKTKQFDLKKGAKKKCERGKKEIRTSMLVCFSTPGEIPALCIKKTAIQKITMSVAQRKVPGFSLR